MDRRSFIKIGAMTGTGIVGASWLLSDGIPTAEAAGVKAKNGVLRLTLVAEEKLIPFGNSKRWAMTYNGTFPGPTLRAKPGDTLEITLVNKLSNPTNLHTHGLHTSPVGNGDNPFLMINPGTSYSYSIKIPLSQKSGTFWYHPHHHGLSAGQVASGLAGALIVEDAIDALPLIKNSLERIIVLADPRIGNTSEVVTTTQMDRMHGRSGPNTLVNGLLRPSFKSLSTQPERWRVVNTCVSQYQTLSLAGAKMVQISSDSSRLPRPVPVESITLAPGQRTEFFISAPRAGTYQLQNSSQALAKILFALPTINPPSTDLLPFRKITKVNSYRKIRVEGSGMGMMGSSSHSLAFTFDGKAFDPGRIDQVVKAGMTEEWVIKNFSSMDHPFHLHAWPFQVADDGYGNFLSGWHDTVNLPSGGLVRMRIPFVEITGKSVYHCHILDHEDAGMMGIIKVS